jgi:hypothetical protein
LAGVSPVETLTIAHGEHSWLYEDPVYRRAVARFLTEACGGPLTPEAAGDLAAATPAQRIPDGEVGFGAISDSPSGLRTLAGVALPGATRAPAGFVAPASNQLSEGSGRSRLAGEP